MDMRKYLKQLPRQTAADPNVFIHMRQSVVPGNNININLFQLPVSRRRATEDMKSCGSAS